MRMTLLRIQPREHVLLMCVHHITADGRSMEIIMKELRDNYVACAAQRPPARRPRRFNMQTTQLATTDTAGRTT